MSSKFDKKWHNVITKTDPITLEKKVITNTELQEWKRATNPKVIQQEWQEFLNSWVSDYKHFLTLNSYKQLLYFKNTLAQTEVMILNYFNWHEGMGLDVKFEYLDNYTLFKPILTPRGYKKYLALDHTMPSDKLQYEIRGVFELSFREHKKKYLPDNFPELEILNIECSKAECYEVLDKCWYGVPETSEQMVGGKLKVSTNQVVFNMTGKYRDIYNSVNMSKYKSEWINDHFAKFNQDKEEVYERFFNLIVKRVMLPKLDLLQPIITPEANPNQDILDVFDKSFLRYLQRGLKAHKVQTSLIGNRGAERDAYCIVPKHYRPSPTIPDEQELANDWVRRRRYFSDD